MSIYLRIMHIHMVLVEPEIPQNTGNIARTCAAIGASLHLIEPLGFSLADRYLKRAGLDYWHLIEVFTYPNLSAYFVQSQDFHRVFATKKAARSHTQICYGTRCSIIFGKETEGLPEQLLKAHRDRCVRIPMISGARSLNLSNAAAIVAYEALRQRNFESLCTSGTL